jgi:hypothetical protein
MKARVFVRALVLGKERHADLVAAKCYLTNRVAVATSQAVRGKCSLRPTAVSAIRGVENVVFRDFCGTDLQALSLSRSCSGDPAWSGGLGPRPALLLQVGPTKPNPAWHFRDRGMGMHVPGHRA